jgi:hypothetical protein
MPNYSPEENASLMGPHAEALANLISHLETQPNVDKRWLAIAKTDLQKGFMAMRRAIFNHADF